jgi:flagellar biosynthesis protein FliQ
MLAVILGVGILTNLLQAATAQSDPTTGTVPRLAAGALAIAIFGAWMLALLTEFWSGLWTHLPSFTR